ncbi:MAG: hypothetical protein RI935_409 [Candidatus Parcubacteria bacterium]|jgi:hypothetical protein
MMEDNSVGASTSVSSFITSPSFVNKWHHFTGTYSNITGWEFYLDGILSSTSSDTGMVGYSSTYLSLRFKNIIPIDEVRIYDRKLTAAEILTMYNAAKSTDLSFGAMSTSSLPVSNGLVGHWTLDGETISTTGATTIAQDSVGGNHGTFTNMSTTTSRVLGKLGQAITFDGTNDYLSGSTSALLANKPLSVSFWAKSDRATGLYQGPLSKQITLAGLKGGDFMHGPLPR